MQQDVQSRSAIRDSAWLYDHNQDRVDGRNMDIVFKRIMEFIRARSLLRTSMLKPYTNIRKQNCSKNEIYLIYSTLIRTSGATPVRYLYNQPPTTDEGDKRSICQALKRY
jgi:hypothetical protein